MIQKVSGTQIKKNESQKVNDALAVEEMLRISINAEPYTITMRSPGSEQELVRGILLTEDVGNVFGLGFVSLTTLCWV